MLINPSEKKPVYAPSTNCHDGWVVTQMIQYEQPTSDTLAYPWGMPLKDVGKFNLCLRRRSVTKTSDCDRCRRETTNWTWSAKGDRLYSDMVGGFVSFINKKLSKGSMEFIIRSEDILGPVGTKKDE